MIKVNHSFLEADLNDVLRLFFKEADVECQFDYQPSVLRFQLRYGINERIGEYSVALPEDALGYRRIFKRYAKVALYEFLSDITGKSLPYGALTGIRPAKLLRQIRAEGEDESDYFLNFLHVKPQKLQLLQQIVEAQADALSEEETAVDLYVGIPFCNGRCSYCSFVSSDINKAGTLVVPYVDALLGEIADTVALIRERGLQLKTLYIGGGTPSSLPLEQIERILSALDGLSPSEYTFEAGRPDSIHTELLELLARHGVGRISVNPQTVHDETLRAIGRRHTFADYERAMALCKGYPFTVNTDLIMGLPGEGTEEFCASLSGVMAHQPHDITVHTLCLKSGSILKEKTERLSADTTEQTSEQAYRMLTEGGYIPYYVYRQKYSAGALENTGYSRGKICRYNVHNMEEVCSVLACGANAITKRVFMGESRIERYANPKDIPTYIAKLSAINEGKRKLFREE